MKKLFIYIIVVLICVSFIACGHNNTAPETESQTTATQTTEILNDANVCVILELDPNTDNNTYAIKIVHITSKEERVEILEPTYNTFSKMLKLTDGEEYEITAHLYNDHILSEPIKLINNAKIIFTLEPNTYHSIPLKPELYDISTPENQSN